MKKKVTTAKATCRHGLKTCIVCKRKFETYEKGKKNHSHKSKGIYKRPHWSKTCRTKCSRTFLRNRKVYLKTPKPKK